MEDRVEAGEEEEGHHGTQRHHILELGLQDAGRMLHLCAASGCGVWKRWHLQTTCKVLEEKNKRSQPP